MVKFRASLIILVLDVCTYSLFAQAGKSTCIGDYIGARIDRGDIFLVLSHGKGDHWGFSISAKEITLVSVSQPLLKERSHASMAGVSTR